MMKVYEASVSTWYDDHGRDPWGDDMYGNDLLGIYSSEKKAQEAIENYPIRNADADGKLIINPPDPEHYCRSLTYEHKWLSEYDQEEHYDDFRVEFYIREIELDKTQDVYI